MNVTLIRPPAYANIMGVQRVPYLGIVYVATSVREAGYQVDVIDMCAEDIDRAEVIKGKKYVVYGMPFNALKKRLKHSDVIGFTIMFSQDWTFNRELIRYVRGLYPESILVAGGEHITAIPEYCLDDCLELDVCVIGEGEEVFINLLRAIESGESFSKVPGIVYRDENEKRLVSTPRTERISDVNSIPWPAWDLIPIENYLSREMHYLIQSGRTLPIQSSRGCPYKCTFCSNENMWGIRRYKRDPKVIVNEMEYNVNKYKVTNFVFSDLTLAVSKNELIAICNEIKERKLGITWQVPAVRADALDYDILKLMNESGCTEVQFAFESGSKKILDVIKKSRSPEGSISLIKSGLAAGINITVNIILGLPSEGYREIFQTYLLVMKGAFIGLHEINVFPFMVYPGSTLFNKFIKEGKVKLTDEYFLKMFFYIDPTHAVSFSDKFSPKMLNFLRIFVLASFYCIAFISHPKRIVQTIVNTVRGVSTTKLEVVLKRVGKTVRIYLLNKELR